jgi:hypothetical protein
MAIIDNSPVHPHPKINDKACWMKSGEEVTWPRVSISMAAKAMEDESDLFTYITHSIPCGEETRKVICGPEVCITATVLIIFYLSLSKFLSSSTQLRSNSQALSAASLVSYTWDTGMRILTLQQDSSMGRVLFPKIPMLWFTTARCPSVMIMMRTSISAQLCTTGRGRNE